MSSTSKEPKESTADLLPRWYFGGIASATAVGLLHPLDLLKVHLQTHQGKKISLVPLAIKIVKTDGFFGLYNGISAALFRQALYATTRFGLYDTGRIYLGKDSPLVQRVMLAAFAGALGGWMATPGDKINVRMQNDMKLPPEKRFNYKHVFDGLWKVYNKEGFKNLFAGGGVVFSRAAVMTVGQLTSYDQIKKILLKTGFFEDNLVTHFTSSLSAGVIATTMTQPFDVIKTRVMNAKPGEYSGVADCIVKTAKEGPLAFFKGYVPAFLRLGPVTILIFLIYEQLRIRFGYLPEDKKENKAK